MNRRVFLSTMMASSATALLPVPVVEATAPLAAAAPTSAPWWVVGTEGEFDWISVRAWTAEEARKEWLVTGGYDDDEETPWLEIQRTPKFDSLDHEPTSGDWIDANLGYICSRCDYETHSGCGARNIGGLAVCEECLTIADIAQVDDIEAVERLADDIAIDGEDDVRATLEADGHWPAISDDIWQRAVAGAATA